jgi:hypothetical protein
MAAPTFRLISGENQTLEHVPFMVSQLVVIAHTAEGIAATILSRKKKAKLDRRRRDAPHQPVSRHLTIAHGLSLLVVVRP